MGSNVLAVGGCRCLDETRLREQPGCRPWKPPGIQASPWATSAKRRAGRQNPSVDFLRTQLALIPSRSAYSAAVRPRRFHSRTRAAQVSRVAIAAEDRPRDHAGRRRLSNGYNVFMVWRLAVPCNETRRVSAVVCGLLPIPLFAKDTKQSACISAKGRSG